MSKQKDKYLALRRQLPDIIDEYISYLQVDVEEPSPKMVERLSVIQKFLNSYAITIDKRGCLPIIERLRKITTRICSKLFGKFTSETSREKIHTLYFSSFLEFPYEYLFYS